MEILAALGLVLRQQNPRSALDQRTTTVPLLAAGRVG
jgi:hypothetical protein